MLFPRIFLMRKNITRIFLKYIKLEPNGFFELYQNNLTCMDVVIVEPLQQQIFGYYPENSEHTVKDTMPVDELTHKFIAVLNKKIPHPELMNALGHMAAGIAGSYENKAEMRLDIYHDKDGGQHKNISDLP